MKKALNTGITGQDGSFLAEHLLSLGYERAWAGRVALEAPEVRFSRTSPILVGDATKARRVLGWSPSFSLPELVREMVAKELKLAERRRPRPESV